MSDRPRSAAGPVWPWYALTVAILALLAILDLLGFASPFAPG